MAAKTSTPKVESEREYIIPLRNEWRKVANYRRTGRAVKFIKMFIARHMKVPERDLTKVKLDAYLNQEIWFRGRSKPPAKIKVKAVKEGDLIRVSLADLPKHWEFEIAKKAKRHKPAEKPKAPEKLAEEEKKEEKSPEKKAEEKKDEKEKEQAVAEVRAKEAKQDSKQQKHLTSKKEPGFHRQALKK